MSMAESLLIQSCSAGVVGARCGSQGISATAWHRLRLRLLPMLPKASTSMTLSPSPSRSPSFADPTCSRAVTPLRRRLGQHVLQCVSASCAGAAYYGVPLRYYTRTSMSDPMPIPCTDNHRDDMEDGSEAAASSSTTATSSSMASSQQWFPASALHPYVAVRKSPIHGRGLFATRPLPKGLRIARIPHMTFVDILTFYLMLSDSLERVPHGLHYTLPSGVFRELPLAASPHHVFNHKCATSNVISGISAAAWPLIAQLPTSADQELLWQWMTTNVASFSDPNSFFLTKDVAEGEELTLNYHLRYHTVADEFAAASPWWLLNSPACAAAKAHHRSMWSSGVVCNCGDASCTKSVYPATHTQASLQSGRFVEELGWLSATGLLLSSKVLESQMRPAGVTLTVADAPQQPHPRWDIHYGKKKEILPGYRQVFTPLNHYMP